MSEDYKALNRALADLLDCWQFPHLAEYVRTLKTAVYDLWERNKYTYFSSLHVRAWRGDEKQKKERHLSNDDANALNEVFEMGPKKSLKELRALLLLGRPDLEARMVAHPRDARERPSSEGRPYHRSYSQRKDLPH